MTTSTIETWLAGAEALAALLETFPARLLALVTLPACNDPQECLQALLGAREAFRLPTPNGSVNPVGDRVAQAPEHLKSALSAVFQNLEYGILRCVAAGARDPGLVAAADFGGGLVTVDVPGVVGRVLLGDLRSLGDQHPLRRALPLAEGYRPAGADAGPTVVLGRLPGVWPGDPLPVRPGAWFDLPEAVATSRRWRREQLAREAQYQTDQDREAAERAAREAAWKAGDRSRLVGLPQM
jgi:hypothetical protein